MDVCFMPVACSRCMKFFKVETCGWPLVAGEAVSRHFHCFVSSDSQNSSSLENHTEGGHTHQTMYGIGLAPQGWFLHQETDRRGLVDPKSPGWGGTRHMVPNKREVA